MKDTSPEMEARLRELFRRRSGAERVRMGCEMFSTARVIMTSSLEAQGYRGMELRKQIFLRTYGQDFDPVTLDKICQALFPDSTARLPSDSTPAAPQGITHDR